MDILNKILARILIENKKTKMWRSFSTFLACVVVFVTTYGLILPAITIDQQTAAEMSGFDVLIDDDQDVGLPQSYGQDTGPSDNENDLLINDDNIWIDDGGLENSNDEDSSFETGPDSGDDYLLNDMSYTTGESYDELSSVLIDDLIIQDEFSEDNLVNMMPGNADVADDTAETNDLAFQIADDPAATATEKTELQTKVFDNETLKATISVTFEKDVNDMGAGSVVLKASYIKKDTEEYDLCARKITSVMEENNLTAFDSLVEFYKVSLVNEYGEEIRPTGGLEVEFDFEEPFEGQNLHVVNIVDDNGLLSFINIETNAEGKTEEKMGEQVDTCTFKADALSAYGFITLDYSQDEQDDFEEELSISGNDLPDEPASVETEEIVTAEAAEATKEIEHEQPESDGNFETASAEIETEEVIEEAPEQIETIETEETEETLDESEAEEETEEALEEIETEEETEEALEEIETEEETEEALEEIETEEETEEGLEEIETEEETESVLEEIETEEETEDFRKLSGAVIYRRHQICPCTGKCR